MCVLCVLSRFSHVHLFVTLWTIAHQTPLSRGFSRQEYWGGLPWPPPGDLPNPRIEPASLMSPALAGRLFMTSATWAVLSTSPVFSFNPKASLRCGCYFYCHFADNKTETEKGKILCLSSHGSVQFNRSVISDSATPWIAARQASLSSTNSQSLLMPIELVMPSSHLILCRPLLLLPPIPPSIRVFSNESTLCIR